MNENEIYKTTLIYCGKEFYSYTYKGNSVYRVFFINEHYAFFEFYTNSCSVLPLFLGNCKNGTKLDVTWRRYGNTQKKIILNAKPTEEETK